MKTLWVIPCCAHDETALMVATQSIRDRMSGTNPSILLLTDPKDDGWNPKGGDYIVKGPPVVSNIRGSRWVQNMHDIVEDVLEMESFTHWMKTDSDIIWLNDRLPRNEGVFGYKAGFDWFCGGGYGFHVAAFREMRKEWLYPVNDHAGEDQYTHDMVRELCVPYYLDRMEGANWYRTTAGKLLHMDALHCGQGYKKSWNRSRRRMGEAMFELYCDYLNLLKRKENKIIL